MGVAEKRKAAANPVEVALFGTAAVLPAAQGLSRSRKASVLAQQEIFPMATNDPTLTRTCWPISRNLHSSTQIMVKFGRPRKRQLRLFR